jgi:chemotaxis response regulator CheB
MPRAAAALGGVMHSLPVSEISAAVCGFCAVKSAAAGPGPEGRFRP